MATPGAPGGGVPPRINVQPQTPGGMAMGPSGLVGGVGGLPARGAVGPQMMMRPGVPMLQQQFQIQQQHQHHQMQSHQRPQDASQWAAGQVSNVRAVGPDAPSRGPSMQQMTMRTTPPSTGMVTASQFRTFRASPQGIGPEGARPMIPSGGASSSPAASSNSVAVTAIGNAPCFFGGGPSSSSASSLPSGGFGQASSMFGVSQARSFGGPPMGRSSVAMAAPVPFGRTGAVYDMPPSSLGTSSGRLGMTVSDKEREELKMLEAQNAEERELGLAAYRYTECFLRGMLDIESNPTAAEELMNTLEGMCDPLPVQIGVWKDECWRRKKSDITKEGLNLLMSTIEATNEVWVRRYIEPPHLKGMSCIRMYGPEHQAVPHDFPTNARRTREFVISPNASAFLFALGFSRSAQSDAFAKARVFHSQSGTDGAVMAMVVSYFHDRNFQTPKFPGRILVELKGRAETDDKVDRVARRLIEFAGSLDPFITLLKV